MADAPAGIRAVAAHAGVSVGTVSNVLNRPDIVAEPTRSRVGEEAHQHRQVVFEPELVVRRSSQARARGRG